MKAKITLKFAGDFVLVILFALLFIFNQRVTYIFNLGKGQINLIVHSQPIEDCLKDPTLTDSMKKKLRLIDEIKKFAIDSIGLNNSPNYNSFYNQHDKPLIWVLTACEPYCFNIKTWNFPIVGSVPYKGFFNKEEALHDMLELREKGYDTKLGTTSGWSTLGWFKDPVLSGMLLQSDGNLAELIIHELTHSTIFVKDNIQYNENLANFVGEAGAKIFLIHKYGINSDEYKKYSRQLEDEMTYDNYILHKTTMLDSLYRSFTRVTSLKKKYELKQEMIKSIVTDICRLNLSDYQKYLKISLRAITGKNAFFMEFVRYDSQQPEFEKEYMQAAKGNLSLFIRMQSKPGSKS